MDENGNNQTIIGYAFNSKFEKKNNSSFIKKINNNNCKRFMK